MTELAIDFKINNDEWDKIASQFNVLFKDNSNIDNFLEFAAKYPNHRLNIRFQNEINYQLLKLVTKVHDNIYVRLVQEQLPQVSKLKQNGYHFFFDGSLGAYNYTSLSNLLNLGVSDVYIYDDLLYDLATVHKKCEYNGAHIRLVLNRLPHTTPDRGINAKSMMITPQMWWYIDDYIDVVEFDCGSPCNWSEFEVLFNTYITDGYWKGPLHELNHDVRILSFPCDTYPPEFILEKICCKRRCEKQTYNICRKCYQYLNIATEMHSKNFSYKMGKPE